MQRQDQLCHAVFRQGKQLDRKNVDDIIEE